MKRKWYDFYEHECKSTRYDGGKWRGGVFIALEIFDIVSFAAAAAAACMHDKASAIPTRGVFSFSSSFLQGIITLFSSASFACLSVQTAFS
jgi:hypothetical protein